MSLCEDCVFLIAIKKNFVEKFYFFFEQVKKRGVLFFLLHFGFGDGQNISQIPQRLTKDDIKFLGGNRCKLAGGGFELDLKKG